MSKKEKVYTLGEQFVVIHNSDNFFNQGEIVVKTGRKTKDNKFMYVSLEREFSALLTSDHVAPRKTS